MVRTKLTARRVYGKTGNFPAWLLNRDYGKRKVSPVIVKMTLPEQMTVNIKMNGQTIKTINVRRKSKYFSGRNRRVF